MSMWTAWAEKNVVMSGSCGTEQHAYAGLRLGRMHVEGAQTVLLQ